MNTILLIGGLLLASADETAAALLARDRAALEREERGPMFPFAAPVPRQAGIPGAAPPATAPAAAAAEWRNDAGTVRSVQARLRTLGFDPGPVDGIYGPRTDAALTAFQRRQGLDVTDALAALDVAPPRMD